MKDSAVCEEVAPLLFRYRIMVEWWNGGMAERWFHDCAVQSQRINLRIYDVTGECSIGYCVKSRS